MYCIAEGVLTATSVPDIGGGSVVGPMVGLMAMGVATGNIKPCVAAFGGDQIDQKDTAMISKFFSLFYMSVNVGAMLVMIIVPIMRTEIQCYGGDCYFAVFGLNAAAIVIGTLVFAAGSGSYNKKEPEGSIVIKVAQMMKHALSQKSQNKHDGIVYQHWLDNAQDKFGMKEINEVKSTMKCLSLYIGIPVFWALFHQQGSSWTLQAEQMDGDLGGFVLRSDHIQFFNPVLVLMIIPLFETIVYPCFTKIGMPLTPIKKMTFGMILTSVAFATSAFVQMQIENVGAPPALPPTGKVSVDFVNVSPCETVELQPESFFKVMLPYGQRSGHKIGSPGMRTFKVLMKGCVVKADSISGDVTVNFTTGHQNLYIDLANMKPKATVVDLVYSPVNVNLPQSRVRTVYAPAPHMAQTVDISYKMFGAKGDAAAPKHQGVTEYNSEYKFVLPEEYMVEITAGNQTIEVHFPNSKNNYIALGTFGAYTIIVQRKLMAKPGENQLEAHVFTDIAPVVVHRLLQLPQYAIITSGEVLLSVTGLEFAYSQAPQSMKSVIQSLWLLTTAFGDLIVMILAVAKPVEGVVQEMFLYAGLMLIVAFVFAVQGYYYVYTDYSGNENEPTPEDALNGDVAHGSDSTTQL